MVTDQIADLLTRIRNAQRVGHPTVSVPASKSKTRILDVLVAEGYLEKYETSTSDSDKPELKVHLRYDSRGEPVIRDLQRMSRPGRRYYVPAEKIPVHKSGLGTVVISTSKGMITGREAKTLGVGGELILSVF